MRDVKQEITPVESDDLYVILDHENAKFDYPIHCHAEYEINLVLHTAGSRVVGSSQDDFGEVDLVLLAPYVPHVWKSELVDNHVVTVQFSGDMLSFPMLQKRQFKAIRELLTRAVPAVSFAVTKDNPLVRALLELPSKEGFSTTSAFLEVLNLMGETQYQIIGDFADKVRPSRSRRIAKVREWTEQHVGEEIRLEDAAALINMSDSAFSHFFRKHSGMPYITYLNALRIARACRLLESTLMSVSEICWECGFNNKSNFNRTFLRAKQMTPTEYRRFINRILVE